MKISIKRAYEDVASGDGYRVLLDRVWPPGRSKEDLALDEWARDIAPSAKLRKWFGHDPKCWKRFVECYCTELESLEHVERLQARLAASGKRSITLIYSAKDEAHNQAVVLPEILSRMTQKG
jgi:uncharacterized protein YeaO (DUF488 family)